jgi:AraC-like DNA-binding protein
MVDALTLSTLILSCLLVLVCLTKVGKQKSSLYLAVFFALIAIQCAFKYVLFNSTIIQNYPALLIIPELISILIPIVIYLLAMQLLNSANSVAVYLKMAILPLFAVIVFFVFFYLTNGFRLQTYYVFECFIGLSLLTFVSYILYIVLAFREIKSKIASEQLEISNHSLIILSWLKLLLAVMLFRASIAIIYFGIQLINPNAEWLPAFIVVYKYIVAITLLLATCLTAYYALRSPDFFEGIIGEKNLEQAIAIAILPPAEKIAIKKRINEEDIPNYLQKIEAIVNEEKLYLDPEITPALLSEKTDLPIYKITFALNKGLAKNFNEYINFYRVEHAKDLLLKPENKKTTIYAIALDCGFSSEAPFYNAFKKFTGKSPSAFRNEASTL